MSESLEVETVELPGLQGCPCFGIDGPPAVAVMTARLGGFGEEPCEAGSGDESLDFILAQRASIDADILQTGAFDG